MEIKKEKIFFEIHQGNPREGPGNFESTKRAFSLLSNLPEKPNILDIGCGPGQQTLDLAELSQGKIYAIDIHEPFLEVLMKRINDRTLTNRIFLINCDMASLSFVPEFFDVIWAEGSIYIIGFEKGLRVWKPFLKSKGYMAATEINWLKNNPPGEVFDFWEKVYPSMCKIEENISTIQNSGYELVDYFVLQENAWWDGYYSHIEAKIPKMKNKYQNDPGALEVIAIEEEEINLYRKYSEYYGYVFYIMQKK